MERSGVKIRAIITAMLVAVATPALADISDYESMRSRLTDVLGSQAEADAAYDKLMPGGERLWSVHRLDSGPVRRTVHGER